MPVYISTCMYVYICMYVCMYACMPLSTEMYVRMYAFPFFVLTISFCYFFWNLIDEQEQYILALYQLLLYAFINLHKYVYLRNEN